MVRARVEAEWLFAGSVTVDDQNSLLIPRPEARPGLYAFILWSYQNLMGFYVGQSLDLATRTGSYRSHTGSTNARIRARILHWTTQEIDPLVELWVAYDCAVLFEGSAPGEWLPGDLSSKANRLFAEAGAVADMLNSFGDHVEVLNDLHLE